MASAELKELVELAKEAGLEGTELSNFLRDERSVNGRKRSVNAKKRSVNISVNGRKRSVNGRKMSVNVTENERRLKVMLCNERLTDATR